MTLSQIGPYPIEREVGRGGMGVVYLGRDPRLKRPVAIKVLPDSFAKDPERLARFEREARLLASLTHPNIAGIYGLEEADGKRFLSLEFVEGETLTEHLRRGPMPIEETLDVCRQIAGALEAAHEAGIVHRDLKPGNVKLTPTGEVKVLDFGLAKGASSGADSSPDLSQSPTVTQAVTATGAGVILGTAAYMSPEQARGKMVDRRTDIWSFGCVLYECLTGEQAFAGETVSDMIALILQGEPDWSRLPASTPEKLKALLGRCLEKDARRRLRDIGDARIELEELQGGRVSGAMRASGAAATAPAVPVAAPAGAAWRKPVAAAALVIIGALAGVAAWTFLGPRSAPPPAMRFTIQAPPRLTLSTDPNDQAISPDGTLLAFVASDSSGQSSMWVRPLGSFKSHELPGTRNATLPFWSPDGAQIAFFADGKLKRIRVKGGTPDLICDAASGRGASWSGKDVIVFGPGPTGPLFKVKASGGTPEAVTVVDTAAGETAHRWPSFLPDGEHFTYAALPAQKGEFACYIGSLGSRDRVPLFSAVGAPIYAPPGYLIFTRNDALLAQRFNVGSRKLIGDPYTIGDPPAATTYTASPCASVSRNGVLSWMSAGKLDRRLVWLDRSGREVGTVAIPLDRWNSPVISPDGRRAMITQDIATGNSDLWMVDLDRELANRLTYESGANNPNCWSPDGREILFSSNRKGTRDIYRRAADGSGSDQLVYESNVPFKDANAWSPDGRWIIFHEIGDENGWNLMLLPAGGGAATPYLVTPFNEQNADISPDGNWVAYDSDESGTPQLYLQSFPKPGNKLQVTKTGAYYGVWVKHGREILWIRLDAMTMSTQIDWSSGAPRIGPSRELFRIPSDANGWSPTPDGERVLITVPAERRVPGISIAVNWSAGHEE